MHPVLDIILCMAMLYLELHVLRPKDTGRMAECTRQGLHNCILTRR